MWLDKNNIETIYAPEKRDYKKELFESSLKAGKNHTMK